jgi:hypothetical protein
MLTDVFEWGTSSTLTTKRNLHAHGVVGSHLEVVAITIQLAEQTHTNIFTFIRTYMLSPALFRPLHE